MLRILFGFEGRIGRRNYWLAIFGQWMIMSGMFFAFGTALTAMFGVVGIDMTPGAAPPDVEALTPGETLFASGLGVASVVFLIIVVGMSIYMSTAAQAKRLHDMNLSGWLTLLNFASFPIAATLILSDPANGPIALFIMLIPVGLGLACGFFPGTVGANDYGAVRISIFDTETRTDENWADRAQAHRAALREKQEAAQQASDDDDTPRERNVARRAPSGGGRKGFGKRGMA